MTKECRAGKEKRNFKSKIICVLKRTFFPNSTSITCWVNVDGVVYKIQPKTLDSTNQRKHSRQSILLQNRPHSLLSPQHIAVRKETIAPKNKFIFDSNFIISFFSRVLPNRKLFWFALHWTTTFVCQKKKEK